MLLISHLDSVIDCVDIIGSLPGADPGKESQHLDVVMGWAKQSGIRLHVHVDELNRPTEKETELPKVTKTKKYMTEALTYVKNMNKWGTVAASSTGHWHTGTLAHHKQHTSPASVPSSVYV